MKKSTTLLQAAAVEAQKARTIAETASGAERDMTTEEKAAFDAAFAQARHLKAQADAAKADEAVLDEVAGILDSAGAPQSVKDDTAATVHGDGGTPASRAKSLGLQVVQAPEMKAALAQFKQADGSIHVREKARFSTDPIHVKDLFTGGSATSAGAFITPDQSGIVELLGRRSLAIRDVISVRRTTSDAVEYVVQTAHTNNAAPVPEAITEDPVSDSAPVVTAAEAGVKPKGSWAFERRSTPVRTIAEWVPATKRSLSDLAALEGLINDELRADVAEAEEDQIVSGDGTGENLDGILNLSGTQAQAFDTDIFVTVRKALTKVRTIGRALPNGVGLNPTDVETIDLAREGGATGPFFGGGPFAVGPRTLWGVPIVESEAIPAGTAIVADWRKFVLWDREQTTVTMTDSHEDFFVRNLVAILAEERVAFAGVRPSAAVVTALA